jgi:hypothetical protein
MTTHNCFVNNQGWIHGKYASYQGSHMDDKTHENLGYMKEKKAMVIWCDNKSAISLTKNHIQFAWTKHIDVQHHFVWEWVENGEITFEYCSKKDMVPNVLTKALQKEWHNKLIAMFGLKKLHRMGVLQILIVFNSQRWWMY